MYYMTFSYHSRRALQFRDDDLHTEKEITSLQERRNVLQSRLNTWFKIQNFYIPVAQTLRGVQDVDDAGASGHVETYDMEDASPLSTDHDAEKAKLFLPSQLPPSLWSTGCIFGLHDIELKLRVAQASDALEQLKQHLCVYSGLLRYKIDQVSGPGQKSNTRARIILDRFRDKITRCAERYRVSHAALERLDPTGDWQLHLKALLVSDVQGPNGSSPDDLYLPMSKHSKRLRGTGEGTRQVSWIWRVRRNISNMNTVGLSSVEGSTAATESDVDDRE